MDLTPEVYGGTNYEYEYIDKSSFTSLREIPKWGGILKN